MAINVTIQYLEITEVDDVLITPTQQDPEVGDYVRDIRVMSAGQLVVQLRIRAITRQPLDVTAPAQEF